MSGGVTPPPPLSVLMLSYPYLPPLPPFYKGSLQTHTLGDWVVGWLGGWVGGGGGGSGSLSSH